MMIWCVEDDQSIRELEIYTLTQTNMQAKGFADGASFFAALETEMPDLILLDIMLPDMDGVSILKELRNSAKTKDLPVIMATAKGMEYDKIQSLDSGADDYLVKPFSMLEMVSRVKAVLRRSAPKTAEKITVAGVSLNPTEHTVTIDDARITLTFKEYELLKLFMENPGTVFTRDQLFSNIWGSDYMGESRTVDMHIRTLRQKIEPYGHMIETVRNVGYRLEVRDDK